MKFMIQKMMALFSTIVVLSIPAGLAAQTDDVASETFPFKVTGTKSLEVILDVDAGSVRVERGTEGASGSVQADYYRDDYRVKVKFDEKENRLHVRVDNDNWTKIKHDKDDRENRWAKIRVTLPHGVDQTMDARIKAGEVKMDAGGMRFREFSVTTWAGEVDIRFDEPNAVVMDDLEINTKVGESHLRKLGNARFKQALIDGGIGEMTLDFLGKLEGGSRAKVDLDIGETTVILPDSAGIRLRVGGGLGFLSHKSIDASLTQRGRYYYSDDYDGKEKGFYLLITPGLGELNVERE
jgi:hypothetical protein